LLVERLGRSGRALDDGVARYLEIEGGVVD
jgi:hypothetical protein